MRALTTAALATLALVAAGCGGSSGSSGSATGSEGAAAVVPRDAAAYVAIDTDSDSGQWKQADGLLDKFPSKDRLLASLRGQLRQENVDYERDVKPALGDEVDVAVLRLQGRTTAVALTKPKDEAKLDALLRKGDAPHPVHARVGDWTAIAMNQAALDRVKAASDGDSLADDEAFGDAFGKLPGEAVAKFFVRGSGLESSLGQTPLGPLGTAIPQARSLDYVVGSLVAEDDGFRLEGKAKSRGGAGGASHESKLLSQAPAGAYLFVSAQGSKQALSGLRSNPALRDQLPQIEQGLGVTLDQLGALFQDELALYVRQGTPIPEVTLVSLVDDEATARSTLDRLGTRLGALVGGAPSATTVDGVAAKRLTVGGRFSIYYATFDGKIVVTTAQSGISGLKGGSKLTDDDAFKSAKSAAKLPDSTSGFVYVNLKQAIPVLESLAQLGGAQVPSQVGGNLAPLRSFVAYSARDGDESTFGAFLQLDK